jgi:hypothetical protein
VEEIWKPAFEFEDAYEVSNLGRVMRIKRGPHTRPGLILKPSNGRRNYKRVGLRNGGPLRLIQLHRLVWQSFNGPIAPGLQINHINGKGDDNRLVNLEVVTPSENLLHSFRVLGNPPSINPNPGEKNGRAKIKWDDIPEVFRLRSEGCSQQRIADHFQINQTNVSRILLGKAWKH